jgi:hypothetical protein
VSSKPGLVTEGDRVFLWLAAMLTFCLALWVGIGFVLWEAWAKL